MIGLPKAKRAHDDIQLQIEKELAAILPLLDLEPCAVELVSFESATGVALIHFSGECEDCSASAATFLPGIETRLKLQVAELRQVRIHVPGER